VRASPDGYTLLLVGNYNAVNATLYEKLNFNFIRDIVPVASISRENSVMVVHPLFPAKTVPEFIAYAKANPGKINMASCGNGAGARLPRLGRWGFAIGHRQCRLSWRNERQFHLANRRRHWMQGLPRELPAPRQLRLRPARLRYELPRDT
jgi:Tripartite tricarboxylate transporter family receptor